MQEINGGRRESSSSCVPPGFRFHPTDEELVGYYLRKKVASHKIDLDVITDIDLYRIEPWDLQEKCGMGYEEQKEWYFFSHKDKKYPTGTRTNRATVAGFWKATGRDKAVYDRTKVIGMRKTLVFYKGRAPHGHKTDWIMHEYRLHSQDINTPPQEEGWVVCRAFKKRMTGQSKTSIEAGWDPTYYYDESTNSQSHNLCKQEIEAPLDHHSQHYAQSDPFVQLPQLESPSLPPMKNPSPISHTPKLLNDHNSEDDVCINRRSDDTKKVTDWRDLDKFVASQLSHGDGYNDDDQILNIHSDSDLGLRLLQSGREETSAGPKLNELSTSDCDIGICIFNN